MHTHACVPAIIPTVRSCFVLAPGLVPWLPSLCSLCLNKRPLPLFMVVRARVTGGSLCRGYVTVSYPPAPRCPSAFLNRGAVGTGATKKRCCVGSAQRLASMSLVFRKNASKGMPLGPFLTLWSPKTPSPLFQSHCRSHSEIRGLLPAQSRVDSQTWTLLLSPSVPAALGEWLCIATRFV